MTSECVKTNLNKMNQRAHTLLRNIWCQVLILKKPKRNKLKIITTPKKFWSQARHRSAPLSSSILTKNRLASDLLQTRGCCLKLTRTKNNHKVKAYLQLVSLAHMTWLRQVNSLTHKRTRTLKKRIKLSSSPSNQITRPMLLKLVRISRLISRLIHQTRHSGRATYIKLTLIL